MSGFIETYRGVFYPWHCDQMGHVNVQHYMAIYDQSSVHLFMALGIMPSHIQAERRGFADVKHEIEYQGELQAGDAVRGEGRITRLGNTSLHHEHRFWNTESEALAARFACVSVYFDLEARKALPITDEIRAKAERFLARSEG